jgi:hypothetical protein
VLLDGLQAGGQVGHGGGVAVDVHHRAAEDQGDERAGDLVPGVFEDDLDEKVAAISSAIEPVMMILLAIMAGGLVGGILFPIYALVNSIA